MSNGNNNGPGDKPRSAGQPGSNQEGGDFTDAVSRLESAVQELVSVAKDQTFDKATRFIDETSKRIESELRFNRVADEDADRDREHRRRRRRYRHGRSRRRYSAVGPKSARLTRDPTDEKIAGVCSGIAHYFGFETWVVRLGALTGLVFLPGIVFPAYWVAYFVMGTPDKASDSASTDSADAPRRSRRSRRERTKSADPIARIREAPISFQPSRSLRNSSADYSQIELRLRRMETFITSGRYELDKELRKIEQEG